MTGYLTGCSREGLERARQTQCYSRIIHLAKLNPNCHMNYSIIFTEISFSPETSNLAADNLNCVSISVARIRVNSREIASKQIHRCK